MIRNRLKRFGSLVFLLATAACQAQNGRKLSLDDAINVAFKNRPEVMIAQSQLGVAIARLRQSHSGLMPNILLQGVATDGPPGAPSFGPIENPALLGTNPLSLEGLAADPLKKQYGAGLTINQTIFDFGRTNHLVAARSNLVDAARIDASEQMSEVVLSVQLSYFAVLHAQSIEEVQEQNLKQRQATLAQAKAFV